MAYVRITVLLALAAVLLVGCGSGLDVNYDSPGTYDAVKFANAALDFARDEGKTVALREFMLPSTPFKKGQLYIFAVGFDGKILSHPYRRDLVGRDIHEVLGTELAEEMLRQAGHGGGWVRTKYHWPNPATGKEELKEAYVVNIDNRWFVGTGIYGGAPADPGDGE